MTVTVFRVTGLLSRLERADADAGILLWLFRDAQDLDAATTAAAAEPSLPARTEIDLELALRRLFESNLIGIITGEGDRILSANDAFLEMVGYSRAEFERGGIDWASLTPEEWLEVDAAAGEQMLRTGVSEVIEKEYARRDGGRVRVRIAGAVVEFEPFRWVSFVEDVTDLAMQTQRLHETNQRLNELVGMAAHDLRTRSPRSADS